MGQIDPDIPVLGQPTTSEDPKIQNALLTIRNEINGELDNTNIRVGADIDGAKIADGTITGQQISTGANMDGSGLADDTVTAAKLNLTNDNEVLASDSAAIGASETTVLQTSNMEAGTYLALCSGTVQVTNNEVAVVRLMGIGFELNKARILVSTTDPLVDSEVPFSLHWIGGFAGGYPFEAKIQAPGGGLAQIKMRAGSRISAIRLG